MLKRYIKQTGFFIFLNLTNLYKFFISLTILCNPPLSIRYLLYRHHLCQFYFFQYFMLNSHTLDIIEERKGDHIMDYKIKGDSDCPIVEINLQNNETVKIERGSMAYMSNVTIEGKMNSNKKGLGGVLGAIGRSLTSGESMFITEATGTSHDGLLGIAPSIPGKIVCLEVNSQNHYYLNNGAFLACDNSVSYEMKTQSVGKALFGGTGGFFVMHTFGQGDLLINAYGDIMEINVDDAHPITIDNEHVVAWDDSLDYEIKIASGTFGFTTGEGLVNVFHGNGKVYIQSRNLHSLADALTPFIPKTKD